VSAPWLVAMDWRDALFVHWPCPAAELQARLPADLTLDTWDGEGWISLVAFRIAAARPRGFPHALGWPAFGEINLRTYVAGAGHAGVWFFSLDAESSVAVSLARAALHLPYHRAQVLATWDEARVTYFGARDGEDEVRYAVEATFGATEATAAPAAPGTLAHWLVERYAFFTVDRRGRTQRGDVAHEPWALRDVSVRAEANLLLDAAGLARPATPPLAHVARGVTMRARTLQPVGA
jgi:uncharacterized protein YqjF (DUF2071 family)